MNRRHRLLFGGPLLAVIFAALAVMPAAAQTFNSGSTGADGAFNPPTNVPPGTTVSGSTYTVPLPPNGIYNFTTITIGAGITVRFTRNATNTPVILLAQGAVSVSGTIDVSAGSAGSFGRPGVGGPGGFDGGAGSDGVTTGVGGAGLGPGGGGGGTASGGGGAGYATTGNGGSGSGGGPGGPAYGGPALRPILGGSGGGGGGTAVGVAAGGGGGGGGGALLIASSTSIALNSGSAIRANGSNGGDSCGQSSCGAGGGGSGGAIRLIANSISGAGQFLAQGGSYGYPYTGGSGANGRIRVEATTLTYTGPTTPIATSGFPQPVFPSAGQPTLTIASVGGIAAPATPSGSLLAAPDILLPTGTTNPVAVDLTASNVSVGTTVQVTATPQNGAPTTASCTLAGTLASSACTATLNISLTQTNVIMASATFPLLSSAGIGPLYADGEEVTHIRVAAVVGGGSSMSYITRSGREILVR